MRGHQTPYPINNALQSRAIPFNNHGSPSHERQCWVGRQHRRVTIGMEPGAWVKLQGLVQRADLNETGGELGQWVAESQRWVVKLPGAENILVRVENLQLDDELVAANDGLEITPTVPSEPSRADDIEAMRDCCAGHAAPTNISADVEGDQAFAFRQQVFELLSEMGTLPLGQLQEHLSRWCVTKQRRQHSPPAGKLRPFVADCAELELVPWVDGPNVGEMKVRLSALASRGVPFTGSVSFMGVSHNGLKNAVVRGDIFVPLQVLLPDVQIQDGTVLSGTMVLGEKGQRYLWRATHVCVLNNAADSSAGVSVATSEASLEVTEVPVPVSRAIVEILREAKTPLLSARLALLLYGRSQSYDADVKAAGGIEKLAGGVDGVAVSYPNGRNAVFALEYLQLDEHVNFLTSSQWAGGTSPVWMPTGAPLPEILALIPATAKGIKINDVGKSLQRSLQLEKTIKHLRLAMYLQAYPEHFSFRTTPEGITYNVQRAGNWRHKSREKISTPAQGAVKQRSLQVIREMMEGQPQGMDRETLISSLGGKFGNMYPSLNAAVRSEFGGFHAFMLEHADMLFPVAMRPGHTLEQQAVDALRGMAMKSSLCSSGSSTLHKWAGDLGGAFGNSFPELNALVKSKYGSFGKFLGSFADQILPAHDEQSSPTSAALEELWAPDSAGLPSATESEVVELITSNNARAGVAPTEEDFLGIVDAREPLQRIAEVVSSYGSEGIDIGKELRLRVAEALCSKRSVKLPRLLTLFRAFQRQGHFHIQEYNEPKHDGSGSIIRARVYVTGVRPSAVAAELNGKDKQWGQLSVREMEAAQALGYEQDSWDDGLTPHTCLFTWNQLSTFEQSTAQVHTAPSRRCMSYLYHDRLRAQVLGYTDETWNADLAEPSVQTQPDLRLPSDSVGAAPAWKVILSEAKLAEGSTVSETTSEQSQTAASSSMVAELSIEPVEGLESVTKGMSAAVKEAAIAWCLEMDIPSVELLVEAELESEFVSQIGAQPGGVQEKIILTRLAKWANADS